MRKHLPNYSITIEDLDEVTEFIHRRRDVPHKVILYTKKKTTTALFKGLTAAYRDRLEFAEVPHTAVDITMEFAITKFPTLVVYAVNTDFEDESLDTFIYDGELKYNSIGDFLDEFALVEKALPYDDPKLHVEDTTSKKSGRK